MRRIFIAMAFLLPQFLIAGVVKGHAPINSTAVESGIIADCNTLGFLTATGSDQVITGLASSDARTYGDANYSLGAVASSGLAVFYSSSNIAVATISGNIVTIVGQGTTIITASQPGNSDYNAATDITQALTVGKKRLSVTGTTIAPKVYNALPLSGIVTPGTISGFAGAETVTATARGMYSNGNAGTGKLATVTYTLFNGTNGGLADNYILPNETVAGNITPAPLIITVLVDAVKCEADNIIFDKTNYAVTGLISNEKIASVTLSPAASPAYDPVGVGIHNNYISANSPVARPTIPTTFNPANYTITVVSGRLTILKSPVLVAQTTTACSGAAFSFMPTNTNGNDFAAGTTYSWSAPAGTGFSGGAPGTDQNAISGTLTNISALDEVTASYNIIPKSGNCVGNAFTFQVRVRNQAPKPQIVQMPASIPFCQHSFINFTAGIGGTDDMIYQWATDADLIAVSTLNKPTGKNALIQFPGAGPYHITVTGFVAAATGCANTATITIGPFAPANATSNLIIYNGLDFVCLNNNVNATIDGYQWGYDSRDLVPVNFTTADAPFVTTQNLARPITDTSTRYVWVITKSGSCYTKTYFNTPHGRPVVLPPSPGYQSQAVKIYPNPVTSEAIITWRYASAADGAVITITDMAGRNIIRKSVAANSIPGRAVADLSHLQKGMYLVNIHIHNKSVAVGKLLKE